MKGFLLAESKAAYSAEWTAERSVVESEYC